MKKIVLLIVLLTAGVGARAAAPQFAYRTGESLVYKVSYTAGDWIDTEMGEVTLKVFGDKTSPDAAFRVEAYARVLGLYRWFFKLDDYYNTWFDITTGLPLKSTSKIREGSYRFESEYLYDWVAGVAHNTYRNLERKNSSKATVNLEGSAMDGVALFYSIRNKSLAGYTPGEVRTLTLLLDDKVRRINYKFYGPEQRIIGKMGRVRTLKFSCQLVSSDAQSFEEGTEFFIWVTDDANKVPLAIESPVKVGHIKAYLTNYSGLKYTSGSVLK